MEGEQSLGGGRCLEVKEAISSTHGTGGNKTLCVCEKGSEKEQDAVSEVEEGNSCGAVFGVSGMTKKGERGIRLLSKGWRRKSSREVFSLRCRQQKRNLEAFIPK